MKVTKSGISLLDENLFDGIPRGFTVLLCGCPGSGIGLMAKQFAAAGVGTDDVVFFSTNEETDEILSTLESHNWKKDIRIVNMARDYFEKVLLKELEVSRFRKEGISLRDIRRPKQERRMDTNLLTTLVYEVSKLQPPFRLVINSLDFFFEYYDHSHVLSAIRMIKTHTQRNESIALLVLDLGVLGDRIQISVEEIVDLILELERERGKEDFTRNLVIRKVRDYPEKTGVFPIEFSKAGLERK